MTQPTIPQLQQGLFCFRGKQYEPWRVLLWEGQLWGMKLDGGEPILLMASGFESDHDVYFELKLHLGANRMVLRRQIREWKPASESLAA
jgi:hypothetical protein